MKNKKKHFDFCHVDKPIKNLKKKKKMFSQGKETILKPMLMVTSKDFGNRFFRFECISTTEN